MAQWQALALILFAWGCMFAMRVDDPSDLMDNDQQRPASYVLDVVRNGQWIVQHDDSGEIASKPPLYPWLAALGMIATGRVNLTTLYLPCVLATLGMALIVFGVGSRHFGQGAGLFGALTLLVSLVGYKEIALARSDTVFALCVFAAAMLAWRAWDKGASWTPFWLTTALATLAKGPLGLLLALGGLGARFREKPAAAPRRFWREHAWGVALYVVLVGGWLAWAVAIEGRPLLDKLIGRELIGHALARDDNRPWTPLQLLIPSFYFLTRFAPWSVFVIVELWRVARHPCADAQERRFERYVASYFLFGLALFSIFPHQRPDHLFPLIPAAAMLGGRGLAALPLVRPGRKLFWSLAGILAAVQLGAFAYYEGFARHVEVVASTKEMDDFAHAIRAGGGEGLPLIHVHTPYALQFFLGTMVPKADMKTALAALGGDGAAYVVVSDPENVRSRLDADGAKLRVLLQWPKGDAPRLAIVSNRDRLEDAPKMAAALDGLLIEMDGLRLEEIQGRFLTFRARPGQSRPRLTLTNTQDAPQQARARIRNASSAIDARKTLAPGESWTLTAGSAAPTARAKSSDSLNGTSVLAARIR
jgi:hypothetical protein